MITSCPLNNPSHVPKDEAIDLLNVAFENPRKLKFPNHNGRRPSRRVRLAPKAIGSVDYMVPDRVSGLEEVDELKRLCPERTWHFVGIFIVWGTSSDDEKVEINVDFAVSFTQMNYTEYSILYKDVYISKVKARQADAAL